MIGEDVPRTIVSLSCETDYMPEPTNENISSEIDSLFRQSREKFKLEGGVDGQKQVRETVPLPCQWRDQISVETKNKRN